MKGWSCASLLFAIVRQKWYSGVVKRVTSLVVVSNGGFWRDCGQRLCWIYHTHEYFKQYVPRYQVFRHHVAGMLSSSPHAANGTRINSLLGLSDGRHEASILAPDQISILESHTTTSSKTSSMIAVSRFRQYWKDLYPTSSNSLGSGNNHWRRLRLRRWSPLHQAHEQRDIREYKTYLAAISLRAIRMLLENLASPSRVVCRRVSCS